MRCIAHCHLRQNTNTHVPARSRRNLSTGLLTTLAKEVRHWAAKLAMQTDNGPGRRQTPIWAWGQTRPSSEPTSCKKHFHLVHVYHIRRVPPTIFTTRAGSASAGRGKHSIGRWPEEQYRPAGECHCGGAGRDSAGGRAGVGHCRASLGSNKCSGPTHLISGACH